MANGINVKGEDGQWHKIADLTEEYMGQGEEGQVWTAGADGTGSWQNPASSDIKPLVSSGSISGLTNMMSGASADGYKISGNTLTWAFSHTQNIFWLYAAYTYSGASNSNRLYPVSNYMEIYTDILKTIFRISDFSEIPDGTYTLTIGFGKDSTTISSRPIVTLIVSRGVGTVSTSEARFFGDANGNSYWSLINVSIS